MAFYAIGSELNAVYDFYGQQPPGETTNNQGNANARGSVTINPANGLAWLDIPFVDGNGDYLNASTGLTTFWTAYYWQTSSGATNATMMEWRDATGTPYLRVEATGSSFNYVMQYWNGSAWVTATGVFLLNFQQSGRLDVYFDLTATGTIQVFLNNVLVASNASPIDLSAIPKLTLFRQWGVAVTQLGSWLVSDQSTRENVIYFRGITGNGAVQQWTGDYTAIDEFPESTADVIYSGTAGQESTFTHAPFTTLQAGYQVKALAIAVLCRNDSDGGPQNLEVNLNIGGTTYSKPVPTPQINYAGRAAIWDKDPSTDAAWNGITNVNGEKGFVSVA